MPEAPGQPGDDVLRRLIQAYPRPAVQLDAVEPDASLVCAEVTAGGYVKDLVEKSDT
jgi:hypothetical protein